MSEFLSKNLLNLISKELKSNLNLTDEILTSFYQFIKNEFEGKSNNLKLQEINFETILPEVENKNELTSFGIDLPVWFTSDKSEKKIMILAMDPLRAKDPENSSIVSFNSPFTIHKKTKNNYFPSIFSLTYDFDLYITDVFKVFYRFIENQDKLSNQDKNFIINKLHTDLLEKEIEIFKPNLILCLGKHSINSLAIIDQSIKPNPSIVSELKKYSFKNTPTYAVPHASGVASKWAKEFMKINGLRYDGKTYLSDIIKHIVDANK